MSPVFFLALAHNPENNLPGVVEELNNLTRILNDVKTARTIALWKVTPDDIQTNVAENREALRILHFSGHAGSQYLEINDANGSVWPADAEGFAGVLKIAKPIKLVFLNGCSTEAQAKMLLNNGIPAVIATTQPLSDQLGVAFARLFYQAFTNEDSELSLKEAFDYALSNFKMTHGKLRADLLDERVRSSFESDDVRLKQPVYTLHINEKKQSVGAEKFAAWCTLTESVNYGNIKGSIRMAISKGRIEEALKILVPYAPDAVALEMRHATLKREQMMNTVSFDEANRELSRITDAILKFTVELGG